jgi:polar amino acid transport system permease protein
MQPAEKSEHAVIDVFYSDTPAAAAPDTAPPVPTAIRRKEQRRIVLAVAQYLVVAGGLVWLVYRGGAAMNYTWQWERIVPYLVKIAPDGLHLGSLSRGVLETLRISAIAALMAATIGLVLAVGKLSPSWSARTFAAGFVGLIRNTPLIVQISMFYFVLAPIFGINRFWTGVTSLAFFESAFIAEIIRTGILAIPVGQWEAGAALGLSRSSTYRLVVLPQAARIMLPPLTSAGISLLKNSSIVSVIALFELTTAGRDAISDTYMSFEIWLTVAAIYLVLTLLLSALAQTLERRLQRTL